MIKSLCRTLTSIFSSFSLLKKDEKEYPQMSKIQLLHASCTDQTTDAIVNAANRYLMQGGGICGVIFKKAGASQLARACSQYSTPLKDGEVAVTPAFQMNNAKCIIHAVGPDFAATPYAFKELFDAYYNSLAVLKENNLHSISFPLISAGIFGGSLKDPVGESTKQCCRAYLSFVKQNPDYDIDVMLCAFSQHEYTKARTIFLTFIPE